MPHDTENARVVNLPPAEAERPLRQKPRFWVPDGREEPTLRDIWRALVEGRWTVAGITALALALAAGYLFVAPRVYRSSAVVRVEDQSNAVAGLEDLSALLDGKPPVEGEAEGEIEMIRSRTVIGAVVDRLRLDIEAEPCRVPILGAALARLHHGLAPAPPVFGLTRLAWGGERIAVERLEVSDDLLDQPLRLTALKGGRYRLSDGDRSFTLEGEIGTALSAVAGGHRIELLVSQLDARSGTEFRIVKHGRDEVIDALQANLRVEERGKKTGVVVIELEGRDPVHVAAIASELASTYVRQAAERRSARVARTLEALESQLPELRSNLETAEAALNAFRLKKATVDLPHETQAAIDRAGELEKELTELEMRRAELAQRYTDKHPNLARLDRRAAVIRAERTTLNERLHALPAIGLTAARLIRDVNIAAERYLLVLNRVQALRVAKSGVTGNVRIIDRPAAARHPVQPKPGLILLLALFLGFGGGIAMAIARRALDEGAGDSREIEASTGLPVLATIPHSEKEMRLQRRTGRGVRALLAVEATDDVATENLRTLRSALGFVLKARGNIVAISSPSPGVGKTFVCANLAYLAAAAGQRVLLVDADLRRGRLHRYFSLQRYPGLADVVSGAATVDEAIQSTSSPGLELLPCGRIQPHPAELLAAPRLQQILAEASQRYSLVVVDTPPILAVTDPVFVARWTTVNLLVLRAREHPISEIGLALERFSQSGVQVQGAVLNDARLTGGRSGRVYEHRSEPS